MCSHSVEIRPLPGRANSQGISFHAASENQPPASGPSSAPPHQTAKHPQLEVNWTVHGFIRHVSRSYRRIPLTASNPKPTQSNAQTTDATNNTRRIMHTPFESNFPNHRSY